MTAAPGTAPAPIRPNDHVYVGPPKRGKLHWTVVEVFTNTGMAHLVSPFSGQRRFEPVDRLVLHTARSEQPKPIHPSHPVYFDAEWEEEEVA